MWFTSSFQWRGFLQRSWLCEEFRCVPKRYLNENSHTRQFLSGIYFRWILVWQIGLEWMLRDLFHRSSNQKTTVWTTHRKWETLWSHHWCMKNTPFIIKLFFKWPCDTIKDDIESRGCIGGAACPAWIEWTPWIACSQTCDTGTQVKTRECHYDDQPFSNDECEPDEADGLTDLGEKECWLVECMS